MLSLSFKFGNFQNIHQNQKLHHTLPLYSLIILHTLTYQREVVLRVHELTAWTDRWYLLVWSPVYLWQGGYHRGRCSIPRNSTRTSYTVRNTRRAGRLLLVGREHWFRGTTDGWRSSDGGRLNATSCWTTDWLRINVGQQKN